jgi:hypothetical protein
MFHVSRAIVAVLALTTAVSCATTRLTSSWKEPTAGKLDFKKVLVLVLSKDESIRRVAEDEVVRQIKSATAVPSYNLFLADDLREGERAKAKVQEEGFDGAVVMRLVDKSQQMTYVPGRYPAPYYSFYGYWGYGWGAAWDPGYVRADTIVLIETNIYSVKDGKLLWSGLSESFNPTGPAELVQGIVAAVVSDLKKQGMLQ